MFAKKIWDPIKQKYVSTNSKDGKKLLSKFIKNIKIMGGVSQNKKSEKTIETSAVVINPTNTQLGGEETQIKKQLKEAEREEKRLKRLIKEGGSHLDEGAQLEGGHPEEEAQTEGEQPEVGETRQEEARPKGAHPTKNKKLIICFDLNKTLIFTDAASNQPFNVALSGFIAEAFYGKMSEGIGFKLLEGKNLTESLVQANDPVVGKDEGKIISFNQYLNKLENSYKSELKQINGLLETINPEMENLYDVTNKIVSLIEKIIGDNNAGKSADENDTGESDGSGESTRESTGENIKLLESVKKQLSLSKKNKIQKLKNELKNELKKDSTFHQPINNDEYLNLMLNPRKIAKGMFINKDPKSGDLNMDGIIKHLAKANEQNEKAINEFKTKIQEILDKIEKQSTLSSDKEMQWSAWANWIDGACEDKIKYPINGKLHYDGKSASDKALRLDPKKRYIAPSFFHTLNQLNKHGIDYTIVFRTFGHDAHIIASEFDAFQLGKHPFENNNKTAHKKKELISSNIMAKGGFYHIVRSKEQGKEDTFFLMKGQGPAEIGENYMNAVINMKTNKGEFNQTEPDKTRSGKITKMANPKDVVIATLENEETEVIGRKAFYDFLMEKAENNTHIAIRDNFKAWKENKTNSENSVRGKIVVYKEDDHIIFFDDNVNEYPNIVDPVLMTEEGESFVLESQVKNLTIQNKHVVRANPIDTILNKNCFLKPIGDLIGNNQLIEKTINQ